MKFLTNIAYDTEKECIAQVHVTKYTPSTPSNADPVCYVLTICYNPLGKLKEVNLYLENDRIIVE